MTLGAVSMIALSIFLYSVAAHWFAVFPLLLAGLFIFGRRVDLYLIRRRAHRSPLYGQKITVDLTPQSFRQACTIHDLEFQWTSFDRAVRFKEGLLLLFGKNEYSWLPDSGLNDAKNSIVATKIIGDLLPLTHSESG